MIDSTHDILNDTIYESLLQLCWSGCIGLATSAPPCKEYSRLKMQPGGPPPLRTPEHMDGLPHLNQAQLEKVRQSKEIHRRGRQLLYAVMSKGGIGILEQPPSSLAWLEPENHNLFREFQGHIAWTDACRYGKDWAKSWAFASNHQRVASLSALCNHNISHQSIIGTKDSQGNYLSTTTAEYPALLAEILIKQMSFRVSHSTAPPKPLPFSHKTSFTLPHGPRLKMCDGAGKYSTADHSLPKPTRPHADLAKQWTSWARTKQLDSRILAHFAQAKPDAPLTEKEVQEAIEILYTALQDTAPANTEPEAGQPYRLRILSKLGIATQDPDLALLAHLEQGVPTGVITPLPSSHQWPRANDTSEQAEAIQLDMCEGNWKAAEEHPEEVRALIQKEIEQGWVIETHMTLEQAKKHWPKGTALGKLNLVLAEGRDPRLVLDSTICGVNPKCHLPEKVALPMAADICLATKPSDDHGAFTGASVDFKAAHKQVQIKPEEHGLLLFAFDKKLYYYRVCHFGARFSAYWWQRVGAFLLRQIHHLLSHTPHKAWLYVDDLLTALWRPQAPAALTLIVIFLQAINAPISWKKAQFQDDITWCGWTINFRFDTIQLTQAKIAKCIAQMQALLEKPKACRKLLEKTIGLLVWATSISIQLRPFLAPLYSDLHSPPGSQYAIPATQWQTFLSSLRDDLTLPGCPIGLHIPPGARILEYKGTRLATKADLPSIPSSAKVQFVRATDPEATHTRLRRESIESLQWFIHTLGHSPQRPLATPDMLHCLAAADACAEGQTVGIGGWVITGSAAAWFGETWSIAEIRKTWPFLTKPAQRYIASFETLAQFALLQCTHRITGHRHLQVRVPTGTDNTATEAGINKLFTTKWPLSHFLKLIASWSHAHGVALQPTHIPGKKNTWADELSRDQLSRFRNRRHERIRFSPARLATGAQSLELHPIEARWRDEHRLAAS